MARLAGPEQNNRSGRRAREAIRLKPDYPQARARLGFALHTQGELAQAIAELRKAREMAKADPGLILKIEAELAVAEGQADMAAQIPALLHGEDQPKNAAELLEFGFLSYTLKRYSGAARLMMKAFQADPKLADETQAHHRYNAACAAALAGCGQGKDEPPLDEAAKTRWRKQAIDWLKADLVVWTRQVEAGPPQARQLAAQILQQWKADTDLAGIRERTALGKLPEDEQNACRSLWAEVEVVLKNAQSP